MSKITPHQVEHIASLSRLTLTAEEKALYSGQLSAILDFFDQLEQFDTTDVPPTTHPHTTENVFREDRPATSLTVEKAMQNAPQRVQRCFGVPKII